MRQPEGFSARRRHGDRHGRLYGHAGRAGVGTLRADARARSRGGHRRRRRGRLGRGRYSVEARFSGYGGDGRAQPKPIICGIWVLRRSLERKDLAGTPRPLAKERWAGGVDSVGSTTLANVLSMTRYGGAVAACGLAGGMDLPTSVAPFILRGVSLLGIDSVMHPKAGRERAWQRLSVDLDRQKLNAITSEISLEEVIGAGRKIVDGQVRGRVVLRVG